MKTTFEFLLRLLVFPFIFGLIFVKMMVETIKRSLGFLMYGGEWVNYNNSKYKGVCWCKKRNKWLVRKNINKKTIFLGYYINEIDAHNVFQEISNKIDTIMRKSFNPEM